MKAIEIKSNQKFVFLAAVKACGLEAEELKKCKFPGKLFFRITTKNISMNDVFKLGVFFSEMTK